MGRPRAPSPVKLLLVMCSEDEDLLRRAEHLARKRWGDWDVQSPIWDWSRAETNGEPGGPAARCRLSSFAEPLSPERLLDAQLETAAIEQNLMADCEALGIAEPVRIQLGYVDEGKLVLLSPAGRPHQVYLARALYAEIVLLYAQGTWQPLPWTSPEYRRPEVHECLTQVRGRLLEWRRQPAPDPNTNPNT